MNSDIRQLLEHVHAARGRVLAEVVSLSDEGGSKKPDESTWNIQEVLEHLVLAERGGYDLICTAAARFRAGDPVWTGPSENDGLPIEAIIDRTWKPKESAPESATPTGQWTASIWASHLRSCDDLLSDLPAVLEGLTPSEVIYPHFLCGPLNAIQRLEFLRFHLDRHLTQIQHLRSVLLV